MKTHILAVISMAILSGCASNPPGPSVAVPAKVVQHVEPDPKIVVLDNDCAGLARYARFVAILRDSGVKVEDVPVLTTDVPQGLPVLMINKEVYSRPDIAPDVGQKNSYDVCRTTGYTKMVDTLGVAEKKFYEDESARIKKDLADKKALADKAKKKK